MRGGRTWKVDCSSIKCMGDTSSLYCLAGAGFCLLSAQMSSEAAKRVFFPSCFRGFPTHLLSRPKNK